MDELINSISPSEKYKPITVNKLIDLNYDLGTLLAEDTNDFDTNCLSRNKNDYLLNLARDNTQLLLNQVWGLPTERVEEAIVVRLPVQKTLLPRMKPIPKPRPLTKWEQFAKVKGIQKKKKAKLSWDEQLKKWVPLYGFKKSQAEKEKNWVLEVPENADPMEDQFEKKNFAKGERVAKNELQRLRNIAKAKKVQVPRVGITNSEVSTAKDLQAAVTVAKASTASLGKFQKDLPKEKEAKGISAILPGASRKRKQPPVSGDTEKKENLAIVDSILNKRPKLNIEKAVARHISNDQVGSHQDRPRSSKKSNNVKGNSKKPKGKGGQRKGGKNAGGRKRR
ncbi:ribosome biogenesis regulatory protein homolog isoform X2 [Diorhabda sublineata]|uniref:ribosome biogenesis regulatory protein homolog isoform X2 n=1 Tax=Diorhabda sublineata TaxID=1163346 RepID=UPI0024E16CE2|nr:ribosome biogenesis regulatory protein homolog isoform X2 [Diorhabda sublineata]